MTTPSALEGLRVLDLAGEAGANCGKMLAMLGADVILVEPPEGHPQRHHPPFLHDEPGIERSITFLHFHTGKRSITLNLDDPADQQRFRALAATADIVLDGYATGYLQSRGIGYDTLRAIHPRLIWAAITPYGSTGPFAHYIGTDLTVAASGGFLHAMGWDGDPPFRCGGEQSYATTSQHAMMGILTALFQRDGSGEGQFVDISMEESVAAVCHMMAVGASVDGSDQGRRPKPGPAHPAGDGTYPCKDGLIVAGSGPVPARHWPEFIEWMASEGIATNWVGDPRWLNPLFRMENKDEVERTVRSFYARHTMAELCDGSIERGYMLFPMQDAASLFTDPQLRARNFLQPLPDPARGETLDYPGPPFRLEGTPARITGPAPLLGQHNAEILDTLPEPPAPHAAIAAVEEKPLPLLGLRAVELTWHIAGPLVGRWLADQGVEMIKVETRSRPDPGRSSAPFPPNVPPGERTLNMGGWFNSFNSSVQDITLNLSDPRGAQLLRDLVARSDILVENFAPGTMERWGLGYEGAKALKPDIIMISMPLVGAEGPRAGLSGGGNHITGFGGLSAICGPEGGVPSPVGPRGIYPDYGPNPLAGSIAVLAALHHRARTGEGQHIEIAQFESIVTTTGPAMLEYAANGTVQGRVGNRSRWAAPHNAYRCQDESKPRWCAIAVETDAQWQAFVGVLGNPAWASDPRFATVPGRKEAEREIDAHLEAWASQRTADAVATELQAAGVPAAVAQDGWDLLADPQLAHREHYQRFHHPETGNLIPLNRLGFRLEKADFGPTSRAPLLGEHTERVLYGVLGVSFDRIEELKADGVLT